MLEDERKAKQIAMMRQQKQREAALASISRVTLEKLYQQMKEGAVKELKIMLKADVQGSIEALAKALSELGTEEIKVNLIHTGMGEITESDIMLASASDAIVVGFNVRTNPKAHALAEQEQVDVRFYNIIYNLLKEIQAAMEGMLEPMVEEKVVGRAEVRAGVQRLQGGHHSRLHGPGRQDRAQLAGPGEAQGGKSWWKGPGSIP